MCVTLWRKQTKKNHDGFFFVFFKQRCVYLCDWVYVYIHMDIYIDADDDDDDDILGHFLF